MKLVDDTFRLRLTEIAGFHAHALRVIGQDLADLFPERIDIQRHRDNFIVQGLCARGRLASKAPKPGWTGLKELLARDVTSLTTDTRIQSAAFHRTYDKDDINRLDATGAQHQIGVAKLPDIHSLGEILRTVGRLVDGENARLVRILKNDRHISFAYDKNDGTTCSQEVTSMDLYHLQRQYYDQRGNKTIVDLWKDRV